MSREGPRRGSTHTPPESACPSRRRAPDPRSTWRTVSRDRSHPSPMAAASPAKPSAHDSIAKRSPSHPFDAPDAIAATDQVDHESLRTVRRIADQQILGDVVVKRDLLEGPELVDDRAQHRLKRP